MWDNLLPILFFLCCKKRKQKAVTISKDLGGETKQVEVEIPESKSKSVENADGNGFPSLTAVVAGGTKGTSDEVNKELGKFDLEDLLRASTEVLGKGTFRMAYKVVLEVGFAVAVKRLCSVP